MNGDLRQQILVSLRAEGVGEADKAREAMAKLEERMRAAAKAFGECTMEGEDFRKTISSLGTSWNFFNQIVKESQKEIEAIDVGLHKLQVTAIKFADDYQASMAKAAAAGEAMELKEAERLAKLAADYEQFLTREETAAAATSAKKDELLAQEIAAELAAAEKKAAIAAKEVMEEEQRFNRMMRDRQEFLERQAKADADAEMKEAERQAKLAADHQKYLDRELAAEAAAAEKKDDLLAREVAAEIAAADKQAKAREEAATAGMIPLQQVQMAGIQMQDKLTESQRKANLAIAQGRDGMDDASYATGRFGLGVLHLSHGLQDLQYGTAAFLNNIPLIVQSMGGGPGLAGTIMLVGVGFELLKPKIAEAAHAIQQWGRDILGVEDPTRKTANTVQELKDKLAALADKPNKVSVDYQAIDEAEAKLSRLEKRLASFNQHVDDATPLQQKVAREVDAIITEFSGGTDEKSGTQNLAELIEKAQRSRGNVATGGEFVASLPNAEKLNQRKEMRAGILERQSRGEFLFHEDTLLKELNVEIAEMERTTIDARNKIKVMIEDARAGKDSAIKALISEFRKSPDVFLRPGAGLGGVDREFPAMLEQARGPSIQAREAEEAGEARAESMRQTDELIRKVRREKFNREAERLTKQGKEDETETLQANREMLAEREAAKKKAERDAKTAANKAASEHEQAVNKAATTFGGPLGRAQGPGSMTDAIVNRVQKGQSDAEIAQGLGGHLKGQLKGQVAANLVDEVADKILADATAKVRAGALASGGADNLDAARDLRFARGQAAEQARRGREQVGGQEMGLAQDIYATAGGALSEQGAMAAAHKAMRAIRGGADAQQAAWSAMISTMEGLAQEQMRLQMMMNGFQGRLGGVQAQARRQRAQRPGILPQF